MKKILLFVVTVFSLNLFSQGCNSTLQFCSGTNYNIPLATGNTAAPAGLNYGCLGSEPNPVFFYFQISNSGNLVLSVAGSAGDDVDAICWGPFTNPTIACDSGATVGGCGYGSPTNTTNSPCSGNIVDCSYSANATETLTINNGVVGQYYIFMVTNYSNQPQNLVLNQIGGTGSTVCDGTVYCYTYLSTPASICFVNTNDVPNNEVYFNHTSANFQGTVIYRQNALSAWDSIGYMPSSQPDMFTDITAVPNQQAYTYCISQIDSCGNIRPKSPSHTTIFEQSSLGTSGQVNLSWSAYIGINITSYYIYRGTSPTSMSLINQVSSSTHAYTDLTPPTGTNYYKVAVHAPSNCTSNASPDTLVGSNYRTSSGQTTSINYFNNPANFNIYPNPAKNSITVFNSEIAKSIEITDILGNTVLTVIPQSNTETINVQNLNKGIYFVKSSTTKGVFCKKLLIE